MKGKKKIDKTVDNKTYKRLTQFRLIYCEEWKWCYQKPLRSWKYWRKTKWKT